MEQSREHLGVVAIEKAAFGSASTNVTNFIISYFKSYNCVQTNYYEIEMILEII